MFSATDGPTAALYRVRSFFIMMRTFFFLLRPKYETIIIAHEYFRGKNTVNCRRRRDERSRNRPWKIERKKNNMERRRKKKPADRRPERTGIPSAMHRQTVVLRSSRRGNRFAGPIPPSNVFGGRAADARWGTSAATVEAEVHRVLYCARRARVFSSTFDSSTQHTRVRIVIEKRTYVYSYNTIIFLRVYMYITYN